MSLTLDAPCGTRVDAHYDDGSVGRQVWCANRTSRYSQSSGPLELGVGDETATLVSLDITAPGSTEPDRRVDVVSGTRRVHIDLP